MKTFIQIFGIFFLKMYGLGPDVKGNIELNFRKSRVGDSGPVSTSLGLGLQ